MIRQWLRLVTERRPLSLWVHGVVLAAMLCGWVGTQARAASVNGYARGCDVTSNAVTQWRLINPLNTNTAVGTVLWQRTLTLHTSFNLAVSGRPRELVTAGHWTPVRRSTMVPRLPMSPALACDWRLFLKGARKYGWPRSPTRLPWKK